VPVDIAELNTQQLRSASAGRDVAGQKGSIPVAAHLSEQLLPLRVGYGTRLPGRNLRPQPRSLMPPYRFDRRPVCQSLSPGLVFRNRIDRRPLSEVQVEGVEAVHHRQVVRNGSRRVPSGQDRFAGLGIHRSGWIAALPAAMPLRVARRAQPPHQCCRLSLGGLLPPNIYRP
jgi:hypothetical protein